MQLTDPQKIAIVDALLANMQGKRKAVTHRREPSYQWTITSKHCDLVSTLLAMVPPKEEVRPWPKWKKEHKQPIHQPPMAYDYGYPL